MKDSDALTPEQLIDALEKTRGFLLAAKRYLKKIYGLNISYELIRKRIKDWAMQEWLDDMRKELAEDCMAKAFHKGIQDGDNHCLFWVINKYGHHVDFLEAREENEPSQPNGALCEALDFLKELNVSNTSIEQQADSCLSTEQCEN